MSSAFWRRLPITLLRVFDLVAVCISFLASLAISSDSLTWPDLAHILAVRIKLANLFLFAGYLALCTTIFGVCGLYRSPRLSHWEQRLYEVLLATTLVTGAFLVLRHLFLMRFAINEFILFFWFFTFLLLWSSHVIAVRLLNLARLHRKNLRNIVVVGEGPDIAALAQYVGEEASFGYRVLRVIDAREVAGDGRVAGDR
jgi:FlaA1/EpsC-like NDP-sugar epimerase